MLGDLETGLHVITTKKQKPDQLNESMGKMEPVHMKHSREEPPESRVILLGGRDSGLSVSQPHCQQVRRKTAGPGELTGPSVSHLCFFWFCNVICCSLGQAFYTGRCLDHPLHFS